MGDVADMMIEGLLDEESGEYIGDKNEARYGTAAPGFPVSYEREARERQAERQRMRCPACKSKFKPSGYLQHIKDIHPELFDSEVKALTSVIGDSL